ncbi:hypothetical protein PQX77_005926 [Marasmius sp. AFHP31]|nr:hypothetical protein PQX77_005926 [Marasmius sp. AFHP31]
MSKVGIKRAGTLNHDGFGSVPDPFAPRRRTGDSWINAILATALFRCWHILIFFGAWATLISVLNHNGHNLTIQPTLLTVIGTVLGFVISYRTTSSFERYNEGRRLWSQIILATRTFARTVWFHIPDPPATETESAEVLRARAMIEKKTVINLLEAFSVAVKHYLRGEDGIYYEDLYYLVKFLPAYALPPGLPHAANDPSAEAHDKESSATSTATHPSEGGNTFLHRRTHEDDQHSAEPTDTSLPAPATATKPKTSRRTTFLQPFARSSPVQRNPSVESTTKVDRDKVILSRADEVYLLPSKLPPKYHYFDIFPLSLLVDLLTDRGRTVKGKKAAKLRAKMRNKAISHNLPLEISLYLSSYIAALQDRKINEVPTTNTLLLSLNQLVDSLTGLERILTTPIPFSYSIHLWVVTLIYCFALPPQIWATLRWMTIPATVILAFIFFGFLVAGEEIENPFGYDKNDLITSHKTLSYLNVSPRVGGMLGNELHAITSTPPPDPAKWAFAAENDLVFARKFHSDERLSPQAWMGKGYYEMQRALRI